MNLGRWPQQQSQGHSNSLGKGSDAKGKPGKSGGKKGKSKDAGALVWNQQPSPVASSVASSTPQTETSTTVGTVDAIECTALDLCATALTQQEIVNPRWIAFNVDTGAGGTVWPMNADYACERISGPGGRNYKTATGEMVEGQGRFRVRCQSAWGHLLQMTGEKTSVHKPLLSAGDVTDKGHALWLDGNVGYIIQKDSPILTAMRTCFRRVCEQHSWNGAIDLTKERGVYNLYVQVAGGDGNVGQAVDVSPNEMEVDESGHRASGGLRQVNCLRSRHRQSRMNTTLQAMQPNVHGANIVSKVEDVHLHMRLSLKESCQKLESTTLTLGQKDPK